MQLYQVKKEQSKEWSEEFKELPLTLKIQTQIGKKIIHTNICLKSDDIIRMMHSSVIPTSKFERIIKKMLGKMFSYYCELKSSE